MDNEAWLSALESVSGTAPLRGVGRSVTAAGTTAGGQDHGQTKDHQAR